MGRETLPLTPKMGEEPFDNAVPTLKGLWQVAATGSVAPNRPFGGRKTTDRQTDRQWSDSALLGGRGTPGEVKFWRGV